jgi:hypothetical protein
MNIFHYRFRKIQHPEYLPGMLIIIVDKHILLPDKNTGEGLLLFLILYQMFQGDLRNHPPVNDPIPSDITTTAIQGHIPVELQITQIINYL